MTEFERQLKLAEERERQAMKQDYVNAAGIEVKPANLQPSQANYKPSPTPVNQEDFPWEGGPKVILRGVPSGVIEDNLEYQKFKKKLTPRFTVRPGRGLSFRTPRILF